MRLFNIFSGKSPADYERKGDALAREKDWGEAKLAFEAGLDKITKGSSADPARASRVRQKSDQSKESLAMAQCRDADALMDAGCVEEALELFTLAVELTVDPALKEELAEKIRKASVQEMPVIQNYDDAFQVIPDGPEVDAFIQDDMDDYFSLVLGTLPDEIQQAYRSYGHTFEQGYLALNRGEFDQAVHYLRRAAQENPSPQSLVPLELATAYVNLGQGREAQPLLEALVRHRPDLLPAYELLCEIYWRDKNFDKAIQLLDTLPPDLSSSMAAFQIRGETLLQATRYEEAKSFFQELLETYGWSEPMAVGLARANEALGQTTQARDVYRTLITQCGGCGTRIDPAIKRKYADLSLVTGSYTTEVLEYYLELSREDPANALQYCQNISRIYAALGNDGESERFQSIAEDLSRKKQV